MPLAQLIPRTDAIAFNMMKLISQQEAILLLDFANDLNKISINRLSFKSVF